MLLFGIALDQRYPINIALGSSQWYHEQELLSYPNAELDLLPLGFHAMYTEVHADTVVKTPEHQEYHEIR